MHRVVVDGENSEWIHIKSEVPQGTVFGPLLMFINDLSNNISSTVRLFADVSCIPQSEAPRFPATPVRSQHLVQMAGYIADEIYLDSKCFVLCLSHAMSPKQFKYTLGNSTLQETTSHSYTKSYNLKWGIMTTLLQPKQIGPRDLLDEAFIHVPKTSNQ